MKLGKSIIQSAVAGAFLVASTGAFAAGEGDGSAMPAGEGMEKCFGVAKKGQNDCGTASHACAGKAAKDYDPKEFKKVKHGACKGLQDEVKKQAAAGKK